MNQQIFKKTLLTFYRHSLKLIFKLEDKQIRKVINMKLKQKILQKQKLTAKKLTNHMQNQKIFLKFLNRCANQHQNSLQQLIRIYTSTTPIDYEQYMLSRPLIQLQQTKDYKKLSETEKTFVKQMVLKCCQQQYHIYDSISNYLSDSHSQNQWNWKKVRFNLSSNLQQQIQFKVNNLLPYHSIYRNLFSNQIAFKELSFQLAVDDLVNIDYWTL